MDTMPTISATAPTGTSSTRAMDVSRRTFMSNETVIEPASSTVHVHRDAGERPRLAPGAVLTGGNVLPGFELPVDDIFE